MEILYVCNNCSYRKYNSLFEKSTLMISQQAQKYHSLLIEGLEKNDTDVKCISGLPINRSFTKKIFIGAEKETVENVTYTYLFSINLPVLRQIFLTFGSFFKILFSQGKDKVIICDILNISVATGAVLASKIRKIKSIGIVTDVPGYFSEANKDSRMSRKEIINTKLMNSFDSYVFLTEDMNEIINSKKKPYVVIEGQVDEHMEAISNNYKDKSSQKIIMYAGTLKKIYGIKLLVDAFIKTNNQEWELHIYGDGDFTDELKDICNTYQNIKYQGVKLNREIVKAELSATLLINPRPTNEEYTKYSFPSKNMEYMVSGTPMITTKLPGMPREYYPYVYLIRDETVEGFTKILSEIFNKAPEELHEFGLNSKNWILKEKNNVKQVEKILNMLREIKDY